MSFTVHFMIHKTSRLIELTGWRWSNAGMALLPLPDTRLDSWKHSSKVYFQLKPFANARQHILVSAFLSIPFIHTEKKHVLKGTLSSGVK